MTIASKIGTALGLTLTVAACSDAMPNQSNLVESDAAGASEIRWHWVDCDSMTSLDLDKNGARCFRPFTVDAR